jgi:hypothetical protein
MTIFALKRHAVLMNSYVIKHVTQFWESQRTVFALQYLVHTFGFAVVPVDDLVISFVDDLTVLKQVLVLLNAKRLQIEAVLLAGIHVKTFFVL